MNYQGVVWQEIFLRMSLHQRRAAALATESREATVAGLESYILNSARMDGFKALIRIFLEDRNRSAAVEVSCSDPIAPSRSRLQISRRALASVD
jgi:hypothetical protein